MLVDFDDVAVGPVWDPIRSLVMCASGSNVRTVLVDGKVVVDDGRVLFADEQELMRKAQASCEAVWRRFPEAHWTGKEMREIFLPALDAWREPAAGPS